MRHWIQRHGVFKRLPALVVVAHGILLLRQLILHADLGQIPLRPSSLDFLLDCFVAFRLIRE